MAKKGGGENTSKKAEAKLKAKVIEDKTFGLKNKNKSTKVNKYVKQVEQQVKYGGRKDQKEEIQRQEFLKRKKEEKEKQEQEKLLVSQAIITQFKVPFGEDPKSYLCRLFKAGQCKKGDKCQFSHDLEVERRKTKIDLYTDITAKQVTIPDENGTVTGSLPRTTIVCDYFIEAIETKKYGWFWKCPNGAKCHYQHKLPRDYVFKNKNASDTHEDEISIEEFIDSERMNLPEALTPVTAETFAQWKAQRIQKTNEEEIKKQQRRIDDIKVGKAQSSGRDIFTNNINKIDLDDDEEALDGAVLEHREDTLIEKGIVDFDNVNEQLFISDSLANLNLEDY